MWTLKARFREEGNMFQEWAKKFGIYIYLVSHNKYVKGGKIFFTGSGYIEGGEKNKKKFFRDLRKDKKLDHLEINKDFFIFEYFESARGERGGLVGVAYNPRIIFLKPVVIFDDGWEEWEVASIHKEDLSAFLSSAEKMAKTSCKLFHLREQKIENVMIYSLLPSLTEKQKDVFLLAVREGYYGYPRKITIGKMAQILKISLSTCQFHLAKAEAKLMPFAAKGV